MFCVYFRHFVFLGLFLVSFTAYSVCETTADCFSGTVCVKKKCVEDKIDKATHKSMLKVKKEAREEKKLRGHGEPAHF